MKNLKMFKEHDEFYEPEELLREGLEEIKPKISDHLKKYGLTLDEIEVDDECSFTISYDPLSMNGSLPKRISQIIEELKDIIENELMIDEIDWGFGYNARCTIAHFSTYGIEYYKIAGLRKALKGEGELDLKAIDDIKRRSPKIWKMIQDRMGKDKSDTAADLGNLGF